MEGTLSESQVHTASFQSRLEELHDRGRRNFDLANQVCDRVIRHSRFPLATYLRITSALVTQAASALISHVTWWALAIHALPRFPSCTVHSRSACFVRDIVF